MCFPVLPALQSLTPQSHSIVRLYAAANLFSARPHRPRGALPKSVDYKYCLIAVDRFTRWLKVSPFPDITADTVAAALLTS
jgi:hypothetical protein